MDIQHFYGNDITLDETGVIQSSYYDEEVQQALIRRLLSYVLSYVWHADYGAGIGQYVGKTLSSDLYAQIQANIKSQIAKEARVAQNPPPQFSFKVINIYILQVEIIYQDNLTNTQKSISFQVS